MNIYPLNDIFDSPAVALVNPVNCVGVMGAGLAKQFKERYSEYYDNYKESCSHGRIKLQNCYCYFDKSRKCIISFPTKYHWKNKSSALDIVQGIYHLHTLINNFAIPSIAIPKLGCGLGGLECWDILQPTIITILKDIEHLDLYIAESE